MTHPAQWKPYRLSALGFVGRGKSRHRPRNDRRLYGGPHPFVQTAEIMAADPYVVRCKQTYSDFGLQQSKMWPADTLCITIAGANTAKTAILKIPACFPDSIVGFIPDRTRSNLYFVKYALDMLKADFLAVTRGTTQDNLSLDKLLSFPIWAPPIAMQNQIGDFLQAFDDLIENNTRRIAILEEMARRIFEEWFVHFRAPGCEDLPPVDSPIGPIPQGWKVKRLQELADDVRDPVDPRSVDPSTPYVGLEHLPRRSTTLANWGKADQVGSLKLWFRSGDILFGKIRPYFHKCSIAPIAGVASSDAIVVRPKTHMIRALVAMLTSSDAFVARAVQTSNGTKMPRADWKVMKTYSVATPSSELLDRFERAVWPMIDLAASLAAQNRNLRAQRDLLLPKLISGEIDVRAASVPLTQAAE